MKKHWFTLHGDTFLWLKDNTGLVYNAENKTKLLFYLSDKIEKICHQLLKIDNLYTAELTDEAINDDEINQWINSLINIQAGYLSLNVVFDKRPISLNPILKVQDNKNYYEEQHKLGFKGKILQNLHELTFYINGSEHGNNEYFKQTIFLVKSCQVLNSSKIRSFIKNSRNPFLSNINLVGNLFSYSGFERLINDISDFSVQSTIHIMIKDFLNNAQKIKDIKWPVHTQFNVLVDTVFDISYLQDISFPFSFTIFVFSEDDFMQFSSMFEAFSAGQNIRFIPLYNKENLPFFESNIFIEKDELDKIDLSKNEIFMRQAFNIEDFGKLTVMLDGNVYANVNALLLGTIDDSPYSIVYKEFTKGQSWFKLRDQAPCDNCIYQWLCPSPSNYEIVFDRPNLCHVKN
ncbi:MAG: TIGR04150 pseudo-rSAM protein [Tannerella sp.]|jgi:pseudo-rSAM protein|nr:TIGR04150 pseudo-rSAM protein [Tannerella sp.]